MLIISVIDSYEILVNCGDERIGLKAARTDGNYKRAARRLPRNNANLF